MYSINNIIGEKLEQLNVIEDYIQLIFSDGSILSIFNEFTYDGKSLMDVVGRNLKILFETDQQIKIIFDNDDSLVISLKDESYNGPEALTIGKKGESTIVWN